MTKPIFHHEVRQSILNILSQHPVFGADLPESEGGRTIQKDRLRTALDIPASPEGHALTEHLIVHLQDNPVLSKRFMRTIKNPKTGDVFHYPDFASLREILDYQNNPVDGTQYSAYSNRVGVFVSDEDNYLQLSYPFKDALLLGQQDIEQGQTGDENFYNFAIHRPEIDRLLRPKVLVNAIQLGEGFPKNGSPWRNGQNIFNHDETDRCKLDKNLLIKGNNLLSLHTLLGDPHGLAPNSLRGQVDVIYIDPPYYFKDSKSADTFGYNSNFRLATWLAFMRDRLLVARDLMNTDGFIAISMNETGQEYLKILANDIFGENNFISTFIWQKKKGGGNDATHVAVEHEYVFLYASDIMKLVSIGGSYSKEYLKRYSEEDDKGKFYWDTFKRRSGKQYYPIECPDGTILEKDANGAKISWLRSEKRFLNDLQLGEVKFVQNGKNDWNVHFKQRLPDDKTPRSILSDFGTTASAVKELENLFGSAVFKTPKPTKLLSSIISLHPRKDITILDFFAGSGTTGHAVMALNKEDGGTRKFILCEQMNYARDLTAERLRLSIEQEEFNESFVYCEMIRHPVRVDVAKAKDIEGLIGAIDQHWESGSFPMAESLISLIEKIRGIENGTVDPSPRLVTGKKDRRSNKDGFDGLTLAKRELLELYYDQNIEYMSYADIVISDNGNASVSNITVSQNDLSFNEAFHGPLVPSFLKQDNGVNSKNNGEEK